MQPPSLSHNATERRKKLVEENHHQVELLKDKADQLERYFKEKKTQDVSEWKEKVHRQQENWKQHLEHQKDEHRSVTMYGCGLAGWLLSLSWGLWTHYNIIGGRLGWASLVPKMLYLPSKKRRGKNCLSLVFFLQAGRGSEHESRDGPRERENITLPVDFNCLYKSH